MYSVVSAWPQGPLFTESANSCVPVGPDSSSSTQIIGGISPDTIDPRQPVGSIQARSPWRMAARRFRKHKMAMVSLVVLIMIAANYNLLGAIGAVSIATPFLHVQYTQRWFSWPNVILTAPVPIAVAAVTVLLLRSLANRQDHQPFFLSLALFALSYAGLGISMWPYIVPQSITIWQAASPENSQVFMLFGVAVLVPLILGYTGWAYWVFRGKVKAGSGYH